MKPTGRRICPRPIGSVVVKLKIVAHPDGTRGGEGGTSNAQRRVLNEVTARVGAERLASFDSPGSESRGYDDAAR